jgi:hypothetical protein
MASALDILVAGGQGVVGRRTPLTLPRACRGGVWLPEQVIQMWRRSTQKPRSHFGLTRATGMSGAPRTRRDR